MTTSRETHSRHSTQLLGSLGLVAIAVVAAFLIATYLKAFKPVVHVTVASDRAGLLLDKGARVRVSGVPVGEVRSTKLQPDGTVKIDVAIDKGMAGRVPSDVTASIRGTTVFGSKFVDLEVPKQAVSSQAVSAGDVISTSDVTVEANDVFAHAVKVIQAVRPSELNATLTGMATALDGRGERFGQFFSDWDNYLGQVDGHLPALETDLRTSARVLNTYADVTPALIGTASNFGKTSNTLVTNAPQLDALLAGTVVAAESATTFLRAIEAPLTAFIHEWLPVTALGAEFSPVIGCLIQGIHQHVQVFNKFFGTQGDRFFYARTGFLPSAEPYTRAKNPPKLVTGVGPTCYPLATQAHPGLPHVNFDDGTAGVYSAESTGKPATPAQNPVGLYFDTIRSWFGQSGLNAFLEELTKGAGK